MWLCSLQDGTQNIPILDWKVTTPALYKYIKPYVYMHCEYKVHGEESLPGEEMHTEVS